MVVEKQFFKAAAGENSSIHGVLVQVDFFGVLIVGAPGSGKSSLAFAICQQNGRFVADDVVMVERNSDGTFIGRCPETFVGLLYSPSEGVLDLRVRLGDGSVVRESRIDRLVVLESTCAVDREIKWQPMLGDIRSGVPALLLPAETTVVERVNAVQSWLAKTIPKGLK